MNSQNLKGLLRALTLLLLMKAHSCQNDEVCNRIPLQSKSKPLPPDNRFALTIEDVGDEFIPQKEYKVILEATDKQASFIAFTISATGTKEPNEKNNRIKIELNPGQIRSSTDASVSHTTSSTTCNNTVIELDKLPKTRVEAVWKAPPRNQKCVTIWAYVAVKQDVWYTNEGPLTKRVCEDPRKEEDMKPKETRNCQVCGDARYELQFQGTWSNNTHPKMYPTNTPKVRFSDIVGASHNKGFALYMDETEATPGMKMLAEQGNTTLMEREILKSLGKNVRTVLKANAPADTTQSTVTSFRTSQQQHYISLATSIIPSPDWFLGVNNLELCDDATWRPKLVYNLYPMDAGTDSGLTFESSQEVSNPPQPITKAKIAEDVPQDKMKPFAKLKVTLVRTYNCIQQTDETTTSSSEDPDESGENNSSEEPKQNRPYEPATSSPGEVGQGDPEGCQTTEWGPWEECQAPCEDNKIVGFRMRARSFVDKKDLERCPSDLIHEIESCEDTCDVTTTEQAPEARQGNWKEWMKPGQEWRKWSKL